MDNSFTDSRDEESLLFGSRVVEEKKHFDEPSDKLWSTYVSEAEKHDSALAETWKGDMDGILIFAGLFSAVVTAFAIASIQNLQQDSGTATVLLLTQISQQLTAMSNGTSSSIPPLSQLGLTDFQPAPSTVWVNALWIASLVFSISGALGSTLVQQWARNYLQSVLKHHIPHQRGRVRAFLFEGIQTFRLGAVAELVPLLLHLSVFFFLYGLVVFLGPIHQGLSYFTLALTAVVTALYTATTFLPIVYHQCPFGTPFSASLWAIISATIRSFRHAVPRLFHVWWQIRNSIPRGVKPYPGAPKSRTSGTMAQARETQAMADQPDRSVRDRKALLWAVEAFSSDSELELFIEGIPGFLSSTQVSGGASIIRDLLTQGLGARVCQLLRGCLGSKVLSESRRRQRALSCMSVIRAVTMDVRDDTWGWTAVFGTATAKVLYRLQSDDSPLISSHALSTIAVVSCRLYRELLYPEISIAMWFWGRKGVLLREKLMNAATRDYITTHHALEALNIQDDAAVSPDGQSWVHISAQRQRLVDAVAGNRLKIAKFGAVGFGSWYSIVPFPSSHAKKQIQEEVVSYFRDVPGFMKQTQSDGLRSAHSSILVHFINALEKRDDGLDLMGVTTEAIKFVTRGLSLQHAGRDIQESIVDIVELMSQTRHIDGVGPHPRAYPEIMDILLHSLRHVSHPVARDKAKNFLKNYIAADSSRHGGPATWSLAMLTQFERDTAPPVVEDTGEWKEVP